MVFSNFDQLHYTTIVKNSRLIDCTEVYLFQLWLIQCLETQCHEHLDTIN
jgi:hypothetical protein